MRVSADQLHVLSVVMNPAGFKSRYRNYFRFAKGVEASGAVLYTIEACLPDQPFAVTTENNPRHLQLRYEDPLWQKEAMLNAGLRLLPPGAEYVAWLDADLSFLKPTWARDTVAMLQVHPVVQPFETCVSLGPDEEALSIHKGFCAWWATTANRDIKGSWEDHHPGYGWAARREVLKDGFFDLSVIGSGDLVMALCFSENADVVSTYLLCWASNKMKLPSEFEQSIRAWQARVAPRVGGNLGFTPGTVLHHWHGSREFRLYADRWAKLTRLGFDTSLHLTRTPDGLLGLSKEGTFLRPFFETYFLERREDSTQR